MLVSSVVCGEDDSIAVDGKIRVGLEVQLNDTPIAKLVLQHREKGIRVHTWKNSQSKAPSQRRLLFLWPFKLTAMEGLPKGVMMVCE